MAMIDYRDYIFTPDCPFCKYFGDINGACTMCIHRETYLSTITKDNNNLRTIVIEIPTDSEESLNFIKHDIIQEISCCSTYFYTDEIKIWEK